MCKVKHPFFHLFILRFKGYRSSRRRIVNFKEIFQKTKEKHVAFPIWYKKKRFFFISASALPPKFVQISLRKWVEVATKYIYIEEEEVFVYKYFLNKFTNIIQTCRASKFFSKFFSSWNLNFTDFFFFHL